MPKVFIRNYIIFTLILLTSVVALGYILISGERNIDKSDSWISHTHQVIIKSEQLNTMISRMVSSQRGFLISSNRLFIDEYATRKDAVINHIAKLKQLTKNNASQQVRLEEIERNFVKLSESLEKKTDLDTLLASPIALDDTEIIRELRSNIFRINSDFLDEEYQILNQRIKLVNKKKNQYFLTLLIGGAVTAIILMIFNANLFRVQGKRSAAEIALSEREEVFRLAIEGTQDGVYDWNIKENKVFYSDQFAEMLGYNISEFEGTFNDFESKMHPDDKEQALEYINLFINDQLSEYSNTFRMQHKSGRWVWIRSRAKLVRDKKGTPIRAVGAHTDISASKEYEIRLKEAKSNAENANRAKSDFLAHMSHEIRTPLTTINGVAEILAQDNHGLDAKKQKLISVLGSSASSLKDLISDILDFSKIESGALELEEYNFSLFETFEHVISIMTMRATEKGLDFIFDYDEVKNIHLYADPVRLRQILFNLIGNAIKFTENGQVKIQASQIEKHGIPILKLSIQDTGVGIDKNQFETVFERFKQADGSVSRKYGGTGLGLPISKKLATLMGGDIHVESEKGVGSKFSLTIPMRLVQGSQNDQDIDDSRKHKINDRLKAAIANTDKILLVEDYEGNIVVISYMLEELECDFDIAKNGLEAVNLWKDNHYDIILMDVQMPVMDGFTATATIRRLEEEGNIGHTPIIGMTAHALVGDKDKCISSGMDAYLPKPIVEMDLKTTILKLIRKSAAA